MSGHSKSLLLIIGLIGLILFLPGILEVASTQESPADLEEGWVTYTDMSYVYDLLHREGGALSGGLTWSASTGGVACSDASRQVEFTVSDGLASTAVRTMAEDTTGRLWFGTFDGVSVLDHGGTPFDKGDDAWITFDTTDGLPQDQVNAIIEDGDGRLWIGTYGDGVGVLDHAGTPFFKDDDSWITFSMADGLASDIAFALEIDEQGRIWFATYYGVSVLDDGGTPFSKGDDTWITFTSTDGLSSIYVTSIAIDQNGGLWFGTSNGASRLDHNGTPFNKADDNWITFSTSDGLADLNIKNLVEDGAGRLWFGTAYGGVSVLDHNGTPSVKTDDSWSTFDTDDGLADGEIFAIAVDGAGRLWFGTWGGGISILDHGGTPFDKVDDDWISFSIGDGLVDNQIDSVAKGNVGPVWFGTPYGVSVLDHNDSFIDKTDDTWISFKRGDGLADISVTFLLLDGTERVWFGGRWGGVVSLLDHGGTPFYPGDDVWTTFTAGDDLPVDQVTAMALDRAGLLWLGSWEGIVGVLDYNGTPSDKGDDIWITLTTSDSLPYPEIRAIAVDSADRMWFGARSGGVSVLDYGGTPFDNTDDTWTTFTDADGLPGYEVRTISIDDTGRLWFGTIGGGLTVLDHHDTPFFKGDDVWTTFTTADGLADDQILAATADRTHRVWFGFGANGYGVSVLDYGGTQFDKADDKWTTYSVASGLANDSVLAITEDGTGRMWFGTGVGASVLIELQRIYLPMTTQNHRTWDLYYEENDHWLAAYGPLVSGQSYQAYPDDSDDYYYFELSAPATVSVLVTNYAPTSGSGDLLLYGPAVGDDRGPLLEQFGDPENHSTMDLGPRQLASGKYYIRVYTAQHYSATQLYTLSVTY